MAITQDQADLVSNVSPYPVQMGSKTDPGSVRQAVAAEKQIRAAADPAGDVARTEKARNDAAAAYKTGMDKYQTQAAGIQGAAAQRMGDVDKQMVPMPGEFHPIPPKDASVFFSMMMVLGALGGKSSIAPMTAAMNNFSGIMKAQNDHNDEMLAAQKEQFKMNFDRAIEVNKQFVERKKQILQDANFDMARAEQPLKLLELEYGQAGDIAKASQTSVKDHETAIAKLLESPVGNYLKMESLKNREGNAQFSHEEALVKRYQAMAEKDKVPELINNIQEMRELLKNPNAANLPELKQIAVRLSGIPRATNAQMKMGATYGHLIDRMKMNIDQFVAGGMPEKSVSQMLDELDSLENVANTGMANLTRAYKNDVQHYFGENGQPRELFPAAAPQVAPPATGSDEEAVKAIRKHYGF